MMLDAATSAHHRQNSARRTSFKPTEEDPVLFIRVQRRSAITAAATLRVGLDAACATTAALMEADILGGSQKNMDASACDFNDSLMSSFFHNSFNHPSSALFRRVSDNDPLMRRCSVRRMDADESTNSQKYSTKRPCIMDAVLVPNDCDTTDQELTEDTNPTNKRRKVTLQLLNSSSQLLQTPNHLLMSSELLAVDASLQRVFHSEQSVRHHCEMLQQLMPSSTAGFEAWTWCGNQGTSNNVGNWLHAAALWDQDSVAEEILSWLREQENATLPSLLTQPKSILTHLFEALDGDGCTPFKLAQMSGNTSTMVVIESYGGKSVHTDNDPNESTVFDLYCLVPNSHCDINNNDDAVNDTLEESMVLDCELQNGYMGYWNNQGELVLDSTCSTTEIGQVVEESYEDQDDSNDEDYTGNDYPEEEDGEVEDQDSEDADGSGFRNRHVSSDDNEYNQYDYDPTYSGIISQGSEEYDETC